MNRIKDARNTLSEMENLLERMKSELDNTRALLYRSFMKHGTIIYDGKIEMTDQTDFRVDGNDVLVVRYMPEGGRYAEIERRYNELFYSEKGD